MVPQKHYSGHVSWQDLLSAPASASHIVQLYDSDDFLASAVAFFSAEGLRRGEAVLLTGTSEHLRGVQRELSLMGVNTEAALRQGQLMVSDAARGVEAIMSDGSPNDARFEAAMIDVLARARADTRFSGVRWWGEMTNIAHQQGDDRAALRMEELADAGARKLGFSLFCSFLCDKFDPQGYEGILTEMCGKHSHVIPAQDYVRHRLAVNRAIHEVIGEIKGPLLQSLLSWKGLACDLPSSQAALFWIRDTMPEHFSAVLSRAKAYQAKH